MITESRFIENAPLEVAVDTEPVRMAVERGEEMAGAYPDYRNIPVVGASAYIPEYEWTLLAEIDKAEAFVPLRKMWIIALTIGSVCSAACIGVGVVFPLLMTRPITRLRYAAERIAGGNHDTVIPVKTNDEIGDLCKSFNLMARELNKSGLENQRLFLQVKQDRDEWQNTFDSISDLISVHDRGFNIIKCNRAVTDKLNLELKDIVGKKCYEVFHNASKPIPLCPCIRCIETLRPETEEITDPHMGGVFFTTAHPEFDKEGRLTHIVHVSRDITEQKRMEEKLRLSYKMASLGRLTAGVFHEVLNPVNIISSHVQLLLMDAEKGLKAEEDLKSIQEEIRRIVKITDSLLRFSRKGKLEVGKIIINDLLENVISIVEPSMKLDNINFIRDLDDNAPAVTANSDELRQVFLNLIHNAKDAMPDGGAITIRIRMICRIEPGIRSTESGAERKELEGQSADPALSQKELGRSDKLQTQSSKPKGDFVRISFEDTGSGIEEDKLDKIFDPFFTTKEEGKGTGLGLSTAYGIIENHGGVKSEVGKGTTFTIDLPVGD